MADQGRGVECGVSAFSTGQREVGKDDGSLRRSKVAIVV